MPCFQVNMHRVALYETFILNVAAVTYVVDGKRYGLMRVTLPFLVKVNNKH